MSKSKLLQQLIANTAGIDQDDGANSKMDTADGGVKSEDAGKKEASAPAVNDINSTEKVSLPSRPEGEAFAIIPPKRPLTSNNNSGNGSINQSTAGAFSGGFKAAEASHTQHQPGSLSQALKELYAINAKYLAESSDPAALVDANQLLSLKLSEWYKRHSEGNSLPVKDEIAGIQLAKAVQFALDQLYASNAKASADVASQPSMSGAHNKPSVNQSPFNPSAPSAPLAATSGAYEIAEQSTQVAGNLLLTATGAAVGLAAGAVVGAGKAVFNAVKERRSAQSQSSAGPSADRIDPSIDESIFSGGKESKRGSESVFAEDSGTEKILFADFVEFMDDAAASGEAVRETFAKHNVSQSDFFVDCLRATSTLSDEAAQEVFSAVAKHTSTVELVEQSMDELQVGATNAASAAESLAEREMQQRYEALTNQVKAKADQLSGIPTNRPLADLYRKAGKNKTIREAIADQVQTEPNAADEIKAGTKDSKFNFQQLLDKLSSIVDKIMSIFGLKANQAANEHQEHAVSTASPTL